MSPGCGRSPSTACLASASTSCTVAFQVHVTELSQTARGAAASLHHSSFFYLGQAVGPVVYGYGFAHGGPEPSILVGAAVVMTVGVACSRLLRHRTVY